jgi:hypothetical protein
MKHLTIRALLAVTAVFTYFTMTLAAAQDKPAPYVPSPQSVVTKLLEMASVKSSDYVIDLGSGDGRIVLTAAKVFGARGLGVDIDAKLIALSKEAAVKEGIANRAEFRQQDLFTLPLSDANVVFLYLLPEMVNRLGPRFVAELKPGTRIVSHDYPLSGWTPTRVEEWSLEEKVAVSGTKRTVLYLYTLPQSAPKRN